VQSVKHLTDLIKTPASGWLIGLERQGRDMNVVVR